MYIDDTAQHAWRYVAKVSDRASLIQYSVPYGEARAAGGPAGLRTSETSLSFSVYGLNALHTVTVMPHGVPCPLMPHCASASSYTRGLAFSVE